MTDETLDLLWSITNGLLPLGAAFAGLACDFTSNKLGIRNAIISTNIFVLIACLVNILSKYLNSYLMFMISRFIHGICVGFFSGLVPLYLNHISPLNLRAVLN